MKITRNGIVINNQRYWHIDFFPYLGKEVIIKDDNGVINVFLEGKIIHSKSSESTRNSSGTLSPS